MRSFGYMLSRPIMDFKFVTWIFDGARGPIMKFHKLTGIAEQPAKADKSAVCAINDSVGKFCPDK
jgi:hypothetical protein